MTTVREYFNWRENGGGQDCDQDMAGIAACFANHCVNQYSEQLCARITELEAAQTWQPIESAPKDAWVQVLFKEGGMGTERIKKARYYSYGTLRNEEFKGGEDDEWAAEGWYEESSYVSDLVLLIEQDLIAWSFLPTPPKGGAT